MFFIFVAVPFKVNFKKKKSKHSLGRSHNILLDIFFSTIIGIITKMIFVANLTTLIFLYIFYINLVKLNKMHDFNSIQRCRTVLYYYSFPTDQSDK